MAWPRTSVNIPLVVEAKFLGKKTLTITNLTATDFNYYLYDDYLGDTTPIFTGAKYDFEFTNDVNSRRTDRFFIISEDLLASVANYGAEYVMTPIMALIPNPTNTGKVDVAIQGTKDGAVDVEVLDTRGISVYKLNSVSTFRSSVGLEASLDLGHLASGVYTIRCSNGGNVFTQRLVIAK